MKDFAAIDFETANFERCSVCSVGVVVVRGGELVDSFYSLIQPEPNYYTYRCTAVHGLTCCRWCPTFKVCRLWRITARLMKVVCVRCSRFMAWIIPIISFTTRSEPPDEPIPICPIISFTQWHASVVTS